MRTPNILVADHDRDFAESLAEVVREQGCEVTIAQNAQAVLRLFECAYYDLVFLDRDLSASHDRPLVGEIWKRHPHARVVQLTGHCMDRDFLEISDQGPCEVLDKPCDITQLQTIIASLSRNKIILVVDDDPLCATSVARLLSTRGYVVLKAGDGRQAVDKLRRQPVDLMILDMCMPVMNGHEVCMELGKTGPSLPIILTTAYPDDDLMKSESVTAGHFSECLHKPIESQRLFNVVDGLLTGSHAHG